MKKVALLLFLLAQPAVAQTVPEIVREFHHAGFSGSGNVKGVMGFITIGAPAGEGLRDVVIEFSSKNSKGTSQDEVRLVRRVPLIEAGTVRTVGFHLDGLTSANVVEAILSWTSESGQHKAQVSSVHQFPLRVPSKDNELAPELAEHVSDWGKRLSGAAEELRTQSGLRCDFWIHRFGQNTKYDGYTIGIEVEIESPDSQYETAGISIELNSLAKDPRIHRAGVMWDGHTRPRMGSLALEDHPIGADSLNEIDGLLETWLDELSEGVKLGNPPGEGVVLRADLAGVVVNQEPLPLLDGNAHRKELDLWQFLLSQLYPNLDGEPILLSDSSIRVDGDSPIARLWEPRKLERLPGVSPELLRRHADANHQQLKVPADFRLAGKDTVLATWAGKPRDFFRIYRGSPGVFSFSRPAYSDDGTKALLSCWKWDCVEMSRELCLLEKEGEAWKLTAHLDEMELFYQLDLADHTEIARMTFEDGMKAAGIAVVEADFSQWPQERAMVKMPDGRELTVLSDNWISKRLVASQGEKPELEFFSCSGPLLVLGNIDASMVIDAVERPWQYMPDEIVGEEELLKDIETEDSTSVESLTYIGSNGNARQHNQILFFRATLKMGGSLVFPVVGSSWRSPEPRPLERLIVINGFSSEKLLKAVEAYLAQSDRDKP